MLVKIILAAVLILGTIALIMSTKNGDRTTTLQDSQTIRIAVSKTPLSAPVYIADSMGFFTRQGLNIQLDEVVGGGRSFNRVIGGEAEYGTSSDSVLMFAALKSQPYVTVASFVQSDNDVKILALSDVGISSSIDLAGKRIGIIKSTASEYFLSTLLALDNTSIDSVELIPLKAEEMPEALKNGKVDAISCWEPYSYHAKKLLGSKVKVLPTHSLYNLSFNLLTRKDYANKNQGEIQKVLAALKQSIEYITLNPAESQKILKSRLNLQDDFIEWIWPDYIFKLSISNALLLTLNNEARWAIQQGLTDLSAPPDFRHYIDTRPLSELMPEAVLF